MIKRITECPACNSKLQIVTLKCKNCGLELHNEFEPNIFETLNSEQYEFLIAFLKNRGNMKLLQSELNVSYPYAKKKLDDLLMALNLSTNVKEKTDLEKIEIIDNEKWNTNESSIRASDIIKCKLKQCGGKATVRTLEGKSYEIIALKDGETFFCEALPVEPYNYRIFDIIRDLLVANGGKAPKGNARCCKVGEEKCDESTVAGIIGISYFEKSYGDSTFDPVFIMAAVLEWAGIAHNLRGFLELTEDYKRKVNL